LTNIQLETIGQVHFFSKKKTKKKKKAGFYQKSMLPSRSELVLHFFSFFFLFFFANVLLKELQGRSVVEGYQTMKVAVDEQHDALLKHLYKRNLLINNTILLPEKNKIKK
jgi:hypothetical protein